MHYIVGDEHIARYVNEQQHCMLLNLCNLYTVNNKYAFLYTEITSPSTTDASTPHNFPRNGTLSSLFKRGILRGLGSDHFWQC